MLLMLFNRKHVAPHTVFGGGGLGYNFIWVPVPFLTIFSVHCTGHWSIGTYSTRTSASHYPKNPGTCASDVFSLFTDYRGTDIN